MGRISLPYLNKSGHSMFWDSMWDDKHNYTLLLNNSVFIHECIPLIFDDYSDMNLFFLIKIKHRSSSNKIKFKIFMRKKFNRLNLYKYFKRRKPLTFLSKTWIFRYHSWIILFMYLYISNSFTNLKKNNQLNLNNDYSYHNIYFNYYYTLKKNEYNNSSYTSKIIKKNSF